MPPNNMMNPRMMQILEMMGQQPNDLMSIGVGQQPSTEYVTPDYMFPEVRQAAIAASPDIGYLELPQDFGGTDTMAGIRGDLRNPAPLEMDVGSVPGGPGASMTSLPDIPQNTSGLGLGKMAPQSFNTDEGSVRQRLINQMLNMMGM
jgi:hypothetical protein